MSLPRKDDNYLPGQEMLEGLSPCSQELATGSVAGPVESN